MSLARYGSFTSGRLRELWRLRAIIRPHVLLAPIRTSERRMRRMPCLRGLRIVATMHIAYATKYDVLTGQPFVHLRTRVLIS